MNVIFYLLRTVPLEGLVRGDLPVELVHRGAFLLCRHPMTAGSPVAGQSVRETTRRRLRPATTAAPSSYSYRYLSTSRERVARRLLQAMERNVLNGAGFHPRTFMVMEERAPAALGAGGR